MKKLYKQLGIDYIKNEEWKIAVGYKYYLISNYGRVYSLKHCKILKQNFAMGYFDVRIKCDDGKFRHIKVHRLVAAAFCENPQNKKEVHHKDCDKTNNHSNNLQWCTKKEHAEIHRTIKEVQINE
jgi:hypothetical protein